MFSSIIPLEIDETIIDLLAEDDTNYAAVKACSLVCRAFLPLCRKHIFASIVLNGIHPRRKSQSPSPTARQLERLLSASPEIADYIRKLDYNIVVGDSTTSLFQECLTRITKLQFLAVRRYNRGKLEWSNNRLRPVFLHLLHLPTLTHFKVTVISKFVVSDLIPCVNLKTLDIGLYSTTLTPTNTFSATLPNCSIRLNEFISGVGSANAIMNICAAQRPDGQPVIDFSSLTKITVEIEKDDEIEASEELFGRCKQLTYVCITLRNPRWIRLSISNMLWPSMQTLGHLCISTYVDGIDVHPLASIPSELDHMRNKNIIENITIRILFLETRHCRGDGDWGRLDEVLTSSGWSALRQVTLTIELSRVDDLEKIPKTQFPRLSTSKSVSFKFKVTTVFG